MGFNSGFKGLMVNSDLRRYLIFVPLAKFPTRTSTVTKSEYVRNPCEGHCNFGVQTRNKTSKQIHIQRNQTHTHTYIYKKQHLLQSNKKTHNSSGKTSITTKPEHINLQKPY